MRVNDMIAGAVLILLCGFMIALTLNFPAFPGQKYGPSLFPRLLGAGIILLSIPLILRGLAARRAGGALVAVPPWTGDPWRVVSFLAVIGSILLFILAADSVGFVPVAVVILLGLFLWFRVNPLVALPAAIAATLAINWFFGKAMRVPLPGGILTGIL